MSQLANHNTKSNLVRTTLLNSEIRYLPDYLFTDMEIVFYKNKTFITIWGKEPVAFLIENNETVKSFEKYFNAFWKIADN